MIKYLGSKRRLLPGILAAIRELGPVERVLDPFSGTARVGHALKAAGYAVVASDHNAYAATLARTYVAADAAAYAKVAQSLIDELNQLKGEPGFITHNYCIEARFFQPKNGERIDRIREEIKARSFEPLLESILLTSLVEAADRVDSTTGVQMAYLKSWAPRASKALELRLPAMLPTQSDRGCEAHLADAQALVARPDLDLVYLDPPYNQHAYRANYHIWETLVRWDAPELYGKARKRIDCRTHKSAFNSKRQIRQALEALVSKIQASKCLLSFNDEGHVDEQWLRQLLTRFFEHVSVRETDYRRYVGAQIGVHNLRGERVGSPGKLRNRELLFVAQR